VCSCLTECRGRNQQVALCVLSVQSVEPIAHGAASMETFQKGFRHFLHQVSGPSCGHHHDHHHLIASTATVKTSSMWACEQNLSGEQADTWRFAESVAKLAFLVSYVAPDLEANVKQTVNRLLQKSLPSLLGISQFRTAEQDNVKVKLRKTVCVISGHWDGNHVVYLNFHPAITVLAKNFDVSCQLTGIFRNNPLHCVVTTIPTRD
jgi:hypothetical protein